MSSEFVFAQYKKLAAGSGVQNLNKDIVTEVMLPHPDKIEQEAIALVLSSMDELINNLEKEIEKKKNIQIGIMPVSYTHLLAINRFKISANSFIGCLLLSENVLAAMSLPPAG